MEPRSAKKKIGAYSFAQREKKVTESSKLGTDDMVLFTNLVQLVTIVQTSVEAFVEK